MKLKTLFEQTLILGGLLGLFSSGPVAFADSTIPVSIDNINSHPLGAGFDSRQQLFRGDCVESASPINMILASGRLDLKLEASQESLSNKLGVSVGGRYRSGVTTTSAAADFLKDSKSNAYRISYNYVAENLYRDYLENRAASPILARPGIEEYMRDPRPFFQNCGDEYVFAQDKAARLFVNMNISFVSKYERTRFAASFGVDSPVYNVQASLESDAANFSAQSTITISVLQQGGDPSKLGRVLCPTKVDGTADEECAKSGKRVVSCAFGELKPCMDVIANLITYANAQDGENFPTQIRNGQNYVVTKLYTRPFVYIGSQFPNPPQKTSEDNFQAEVQELSDIFETQYTNWSYAQQLGKGTAPRLSDRQKNEMEVLQDLFKRNMKQAALGIQNCFDFGFSKCTADLATTKTYVRYGDRDAKGYADIEALTAAETLIQFCDLANADNPDIAATIHSLRLYALQNKLIEERDLKKGDSCSKLNNSLKSVTNLDLSPSEYVIADIRPIATIAGLKSLNLSGKAIGSVKPLAALKSLKNLVLDNNLIEDVAPLADLSLLEQLSLQNNRLSNIGALQRLIYLKSLDARGNTNGLACPLANQNRCKLLDFSTAINLTLNSNQCDSRVGHASTALDANQVLVAGGFSSDGLTIFKSSMEIRKRDGCTYLPQTLQQSRADHQMTRLNDGRILITGGYRNTAEVLDPRNMKSTLVPGNMQVFRSRHTATLLKDGRVLIVGGYTDEMQYSTRTKNMTASVEIFDPASSHFEVVGKLNLPRADHTATLLADGRVVIMGGYASLRMYDLIEVINPADNSIQMLDAPLNLGRMGHSATALSNGRILIAGGYVWASVSEGGHEKQVLRPTDSLEIWDPQTESSQEVSDVLGQARGDLSAWLMKDGRVLFVGGETQGTLFTDLQVPLKSASDIIEVFDPQTEGVYRLGKLTHARSRFTAAPLGDRSLIFIGGAGGSSSNVTAELLVYNPRR